MDSKLSKGCVNLESYLSLGLETYGSDEKIENVERVCIFLFADITRMWLLLFLLSCVWFIPAS